MLCWFFSPACLCIFYFQAVTCKQQTALKYGCWTAVVTLHFLLLSMSLPFIVLPSGNFCTAPAIPGWQKPQALDYVGTAEPKCFLTGFSLSTENTLSPSHAGFQHGRVSLGQPESSQSPAVQTVGTGMLQIRGITQCWHSPAPFWTGTPRRLL